MLTEKQILLLFLISSEPGIRGIYTLVQIFEEADFPAKMTENLNQLLQQNLIMVSENFDNGTAKEYQITEDGKKYLECNFNDFKIIDYIKSMDNPKLLLEITQTYIDRKNSN